nr:immunoglobulin light chain junction region [Macaca mulatta]MOW64340.1 immunoglobulin light chain junction region [Macaca mulatta]
CQQHNSFPYSF